MQSHFYFSNHRKTRLIALCVLFLAMLSSTHSFAQFAGGDGTVGNPYQVATPTQLNNVRNYLSAHFIQTADIDLSPGYPNWTPIGGNGAGNFAGVYNGNDKTISNLTINDATRIYIGLFGYVETALQNIRLENVSISSTFSGAYIGALVGQIYTNGTVSNCSGTGSVSSGAFAYVGGLVGVCDGGTISNSSSTGSVSVGSYANAGGLVGHNTNLSNISDSYSTVSVSGGVYGNVGGLVGYNEGTVQYCYSTGSVSDAYFANVGGLVGLNDGGTVSNCNSTGGVNGAADAYVGGLVGHNTNLSNISDSYSTGSVNGGVSGTYVGGLVGRKFFGNVGNSYYDSQTSGQGDTGKGVPKTTAEMKQQATFTGWDFTNVWAIDGTTNDGYPYLKTPGTWTGASSTIWATATNWAGGSVPTSATDVTIPDVANDPVISATTSADCNNLTVESGATLTIQSDATNNGSLIVSGTSSGNITYNRYVTGFDKWHLISSPIGAQDINAFVVTNVATNAVAVFAPKYGLAPYNNTTPGWAHYTTDAGSNDIAVAGNFVAGKGYEVLRTSDGTVTFTGTVPTNNVNIAIAKNANGWNLVGNPFPSAINGNDDAHATNNFISANTAALDDAYEALYVWDAASSTYLTVNHTYDSNSAFYVAPGQAFFVYSAAGGATVNFTEAMQTHQTGNIFKNAVIPDPSIKLIAERTEGATSTNILYLEAMTTGLDPGYDAGRFSGGVNSFAVYTHLVGDTSNLVDFDIQCLPDNNWDQVIPIGLNAPENTEVVFRTETMSLPTGVSVFLEDKVTGSYTALSGSGSIYTVKTDTKSQGTGRFFLHTKTSATGIEFPDKKVNFTIIPRPQYNTLRVIGEFGKNTQLEVYDMAGRKLMSRKLNSSETNDVEMEGIKNGVYVVHISSTTHQSSKKFSWMKN